MGGVDVRPASHLAMRDSPVEPVAPFGLHRYFSNWLASVEGPASPKSNVGYLLCLITGLVGAIVGAALRAGMQGGLRVEAGEPYWVASNAGW